MMDRKFVLAGLIASVACAGAMLPPPAAARTVAREARGVASPQAAMAAALKAESIDLLPQTPRLGALKRTYEARRTGMDLGDNDLDFEYLTGAQEPAGVDRVTTRVRTSGGVMTLTTSFRVFGDRTRTLTSRWLRGRDGLWRMDDISDGRKSLADWYRTRPEE